MPNTETVRDPIHQMIALPEEEWRAVDTPAFQRLRGVRQLAMTHLVYPGTTHTRFEHSLGVRHIAGRVCERLAETHPDAFQEDGRRQTLHAALLHDIGHGPFSHVSEQVLDELSGVGSVHEAISVGIVRTDADLHSALGTDACNAAADLIEGKGGRSVYRDIVSGETDADKFDYLLRDSYFAGVQYGVFDLTRLIDTVTIIGNPETGTSLGFEADGIHAVEGLILARHHMFRQVYAHKTRLATDIMITRALRAAIDEEVLPRDAYLVPTKDGKPAPTPEFLQRFRTQTDASVMEAMLNSKPGLVTRDLAERLQQRCLLRQVACIDLRPTKDFDRPKITAVLDEDRLTGKRMKELESDIAKELSLLGREHLVALHIDRRRNPTHRLPAERIDEKQILLNSEGRTLYLQDESEIFRPEKVEGRNFAYLYTPPLDDKLNARASGALKERLSDL